MRPFRRGWPGGRGWARAALVALGVCVLQLIALVASGSTGNDRAAAPAPRALLLDEGFDGPALDGDRWNTCHWWDDGGCTIATNDELQWYLPEQVEVRDGVLRMTADAEEAVGADGEVFPYRSGMVTTGPPTYTGTSRFAFTYGRVEARVRVPAGAGLWAALWMLPDTREARPEIDLLEVLGDRPREVLTFLHPADPAQAPVGSTATVAAPEGFLDWRTVRLDWEPGRLRWWVDGELAWTRSGPDVPAEPMYLVANLAVGGELGGPVGAGTRFPATYEIDRIRVWSW